MRNRVTGGYQYESRYSSAWERPEREIGPIRAVLYGMPLLALLALLAAAFGH